MRNEAIYQKMRTERHPGLHDIGCHGACCLRATDLGLQIGEDKVFEHVDLHIHCGEIVALIGPNGAGKSSLLKAILGQFPHTGNLEFFLASGDKAQPTFGYVPQNPAFDRSDPISVLDLFVSCISRWPVFLPIPKALREKVTECLARVHAEKLIDRRLGALSGGELQRVLLALALTPQPDLLILDEPVSGVDSNGLEAFYQTVDELKHRNHMAILLVSHDLDVVERYADRVVLMQGGVIKQGSPEVVFDSPEFEQVFYAKGGRA